MKISSKLPEVDTSIFAVMSKMANDYDAINLSQGFPDFNTYDELIDLVNFYMKQGKNQYAPMPGVYDLRLKISEKIEFLYNARYNPETEITVTAGATQALYTAISAFISEGDEVIIFEPAYDSYLPAIQINKGTPRFVPMLPPDFKINWEQVAKLITPRTRMIIINSPHNPTGTVLDESDMKALEKLVKGTNILILSDEVYEHIIFDKLQHQSISRFPKLTERSLVISSFGKTYHTTGWKMGYCAAPEALTKEFRKVHQFIVFAVNTPIQMAMVSYLDKKDKYLELPAFYQQKRDYFLSLLKETKFKAVPSKGTYFQLLDYSAYSKKRDVLFANELVKKHHIATIPISVFYQDAPKMQFLRFCFAKSEKVLYSGAEVMKKI